MVVGLLFVDDLTLIHHSLLELFLLLLLFLFIVALCNLFEFCARVLHVHSIDFIVLFLELDDDGVDFDRTVIDKWNHVLRLVVEIARIAMLPLLLVLCLIGHFFLPSVTHNVGILLLKVFEEAEDLRVLIVAHVEQLDLALLLLELGFLPLAELLLQSGLSARVELDLLYSLSELGAETFLHLGQLFRQSVGHVVDI